MDLYVDVLQVHTKDQGLETAYDYMPFYPFSGRTKEDKRPKIRVIGYSQFQTVKERKQIYCFLTFEGVIMAAEKAADLASALWQ